LEFETAGAMPFRIRPVPFADAIDRLEDRLRLEAVHRRSMRVAGPAPGEDHTSGVIQDRVVEIEQNCSGQELHQDQG
jgi:hypothetical protein